MWYSDSSDSLISFPKQKTNKQQKNSLPPYINIWGDKMRTLALEYMLFACSVNGKDLSALHSPA